MKHIYVWLLAVLLVLVLIPVGCGTNDTGTNDTGTNDTGDEEEVINKVFVRFSSPFAAHPFFGDIAKGMEEGTEFIKERHGIEVDFSVADAQGSLEQLILDVETFIAQGVDSIFMINLNPPTTKTLINEIQSAGIKVGIGGQRSGGEDLHFGLEDYNGAYVVALEVGKWIKDNLNSKGIPGRVLLVNQPTTETMRARTAGFTDGLRDSGCDFEIVVQLEVSLPNQDVVQPQVEDALTAYPDLNVFLGPNDDCNRAYIEAAKGAGLTDGEYIIAGTGLDVASIPTFISGTTAYKISYMAFPVYGGNFIMHAVVANILGVIEKNPDGTPYSVILPGTLVTPDTLQEYYYQGAGGEWVENTEVIEALMLQNPTAAKIIEFQK